MLLFIGPHNWLSVTMAIYISKKVPNTLMAGHGTEVHTCTHSFHILWTTGMSLGDSEIWPLMYDVARYTHVL